MTKVFVDSDIIIDFSSVTVLELFAGKSSKKVAGKLRELIDGFVVIPINTELAFFAGELKRDNAMDITLADLLIGATCLFIGAKLATRNKRHFHGIPKLRFAV